MVSSTIWQLEDYLRFAAHQSSLVRKWAQVRLIDLYPEQAEGVMLKFLDDPDKLIASLAASFLGDCEDKSYGPALLSCFKKSRGNLASSCAIALGKIDYKEAVPSLINRLKQGDEEILSEVISGLGLMKDQEAKEALLDCLDSKHQGSPCRGFLFNALLTHRDISLIPHLVKSYLVDRPEIEIVNPFVYALRIDNLFDWLINYSHDNLSEVCKEAEECFSIPLKNVIYPSIWPLKGKTLPSQLAEKLNLKAQAFLSENDYLWSEWVLRGDITPFEQGILFSMSFLSAFSSSSSAKPQNRNEKEIFAENVLLLACYLRIRLDCEAEKVIKEGREEEFLFETMDRDEKYQAEIIIDKIVEKNGKDAPEILQEIIEEDPASWSAVAAVNAIGKLVKENLADGIEFIPALLNEIENGEGDLLYEACINTLKIIGEPVLKESGRLLKTGTDLQKISLMEVLGNIPTSESINILLDNAEELWAKFNDIFLDVLWDIGSKEAIPFLEKEWRKGEGHIEDVLLLHYELNGLTPPHIKEMRRAYEKREKSLHEKIADIDKIWDEPFMLKLQCRKCSKVYTYEVEEVFYDMNDIKEDLRSGLVIPKKITCKNCQAVNQYEITPEAMMILTVESMKIMALVKKAKEEGKKYSLDDFGRIRYMQFTADGGKKMTPHQAIVLYQEKIEREPNNPLWRLRYGNVLSFIGQEDEALEQYQKAVELDDTCIEAYFNVGEGYEKRGERGKAIQIYQKIANLAKLKLLDETDEAIVEETIARLSGFIGSGRKMVQSQPVISLPVSSQKIGRNQPCPCGSGKKYKHCCLGK